MTGPQAGWYPDPGGQGQRYFDGQNWGPLAPPPDVGAPPPKNRNPWVIALGIGLGIVVLLAILTAITDSSKDDSAGGTASETSTVRSRSVATSTTTVPPVPLTPADFQVTVIVTEQKCFGSAGCIFTYTIDPTYIGTRTSPGPATVVYEIQGADETQTGNFEIDATGRATFDKEERIDASPGAVLSAVVTQVVERR